MNVNFHKTDAFLLVAILIVIGISVAIGELAAGRFVKFEELQILSLVSSLFVVAVFMERSVEAILKPIRGPGRQELLYKIRKNGLEIECSEKQQKDINEQIKILDD
uniref:Uncharacterized protein n=1 Tax=Candidatus Kentrum eta TaxID=2126337 RepID=A0A450VLV1_9GAMM|nr:MAG: hypothetical protein BECKH772A_GA0070896_103073 [Candidatus Kentron sp. H]VFK03276.1 MAG: hypothetical protein BECKH772B_GA0070898_103413 [Candidatus Kentron sp. H]VFK05765.1 MAG: hypothetical protein BECKH772C_GA0070978_103003 [Candidatus Kentron sp. H]